ncbi:YhfC family intramembrane metalloprotease [Paraburkholderia bonniea]|uniref:YhfC family intramembrane metalloprotease n=1 Tax=Paraburkholderia bonniea TaxID=2152891 RepID=UPI0025729AA4|nr:YhfC family intramembrane metalloprotease [Paraburkholderia bonniea]WJF89095.1 YhfC family intramembrane metalloprotease [Paraburkholderia bonniea]WJF92411.1 YhfC family intramembrane metalloprotease [Paraburkholderia bonniea]
MPVALLTLVCLSLATLCVAVFPIVLYRCLRRPYALNWRDTVAGIAVFALFAMVLERALNGYVLYQNATTAAWLSNPLTFVLYGALVAGLCEEVGRYLALRLIWRRAGTTPLKPLSRPVSTPLPGAAASTATLSTVRGNDTTALAYGIGHGGAEVWLVGVLVQVQWIVFAVLANRQQLDGHLSDLSLEMLMRIHLILASLSPLTAGVFVLERLAALVFQIGLSVLMWRGVRAGWRGVLPLAIGAHALIDVPAAMVQARLLPLLVADGLYVLVALGVAGWLIALYRQPQQRAQ